MLIRLVREQGNGTKTAPLQDLMQVCHHSALNPFKNF
jgi:hypothetical protein